MKLTSFGLRPLSLVGAPLATSRTPLATRLFRPQIHRPCQPSLGRRTFLTTTIADPGFLSVIPANLIAGLSHAGLPWLIAIPLSALTIRTLFIYPRYQLLRRKNQAKAAMLQPLVDAQISNANLRRTWDEGSRFVGLDWTSQLRRRRQISKLKNSIQRKIETEFNIPTFNWMSRIVPILILLAASEGLRRLCGSDRGLLSMLLGPLRPLLTKIAALFKGRADMSIQVEEDDRLDDRQDGTSTFAHAHSVADSGFLATRDDFATVTWFQESLKTTGFSWCQDLTAPDPQKILPAVFSATFFASVWFNPGQKDAGNFYATDASNMAGNDASSRSTKPRRTFWQKVYLGIAALSIFPAVQMPCALLWYFMSNIIVSRLQTSHLLRRIPIIPPPVGCAQRPLMSTRSDKLDIAKIGLRPQNPARRFRA